MINVKKSLLYVIAGLFMTSMNSCEKADPEFVHTDNFISAMTCENYSDHENPLYSSLDGKIYEYDKDGNLLTGDFSKEEAEGGSGVITFIVPIEKSKYFDLTSVFLRATLTWDESITPSLTFKRHNILVDEEHPEGMVIAVKSGVNTVRKYRIMGIYE